MFSAFINEFKKRRLQRFLFPPIASTKALLKDSNLFWESITNEPSEEDNRKRHDCWQKYLDLCMSRNQIKEVMQKHCLSRDDLEQIFEHISSGVNVNAREWVGGEHVAASTLYYAEPLEFYLHFKDKNEVWIIALDEYFSGKIPLGRLYEYIKKS